MGERKPTRREVFLQVMGQVIPWDLLIKGIEPYYPKAGPQGGRPAYPIKVMLRIYFLQNWYGYADLSMEEALYENEVLRRFAKVRIERIPDATSLLHFRHLLERYGLCPKLFELVKTHLDSKGLWLKEGSIVDATIIHAPTSTKNRNRQRDPEMHATRKGKQMYFGMKAHIGVDTASGLVHHVLGTAAHVSDVTVAHHLLQGGEQEVHAEAGYQGVMKRPEHWHRQVNWQICRHRIYVLPGQEQAMLQAHRFRERAKASLRAKVEHAFRIVKCQFGFRKVRYKGLFKNTAQLFTLFTLANLWMVRRHAY